MEKFYLKTETEYWGMPEVTVRNLPYTKHKEHGLIISAKALSDADERVVRALLASRIPLTGRMVMFLRKNARLSLADLGGMLSISATAVLKWEKKETSPLHPMNDIAVRAVFFKLYRMKLAVDSLFPGTKSKIVVDLDEQAPAEQMKRA